MTTPPIPEAMKAAGAWALHEHDRLPDEPPWEDLADHERASYVAAADHVLAAGLAVCEVEVQRSIQGEDDNGPWVTYIFDDWSLRHRQSELAPGTLHTRLEITTPWSPAEQVDTEEAPGMTAGPGGYGRYADDPNHVGCPRARSDMTPCIARDGHVALADDQRCVGCDERAHGLDGLLQSLRHEVTGRSPAPVTRPGHAADKLRDLVREVTAPPVDTEGATP